MPENENQQNIDIDGNVDKSAIIDGNQNITNQNIVNINVHLKALLILLSLTIVFAAAYFWSKSDKPVKPEKIPPKFVIENPILRSDAALVIKAGNEPANRKQPLTVQFDEITFSEKAIPADNQGDDKRQCWHFTLKDQHPPPEMLKDGAHQIRAGFVGEDSVDVQKIIFHTEIPVLRGLSYQPENEPDKRVIEGRASSNLKSAENKMAVEMVFFDQGERPVTVDIPVKYVQDSVTGASYYEFQTTIEGLPKFSSDDPNYKKPFFGLKVTDQAGNNYYQQVSYAQYIAPGDHHFGSSDLADITVEKKTDTGNGQVINLVRLTTPPQKRVDCLQNGKPPIELKVTARTDGSRNLEWKSNADVKALTLVFRDKKQIGVSTTDSFVDNEKLDKESVDYRVEQEGKDGTRYLSNKETFKKPVEVLLTVKSDVKEDSVYIDGEKRGATPLNYRIMTGKHSVRVEKPGYTTFEQEIDLQKDQTVTAKLEPSASLRVETEPAGATVFVNGKKSGVAPVTLKGLKPGNIQIKAELAGYKAQEKAYPVKPENPEPVKLVMERLPEIRYSLTVKPEPSDAEVRIVNPQTDYQPGLRLKPGTYQISVSREGFKAKNSPVEIKNEDVLLDVVLEKEEIYSAQERVALVIGNAGYKTSTLRTPANDAKDMTTTLEKIGFTTTTLINAGRKDMVEAIRVFGEKLKKFEVGLFYFSGYGIQYNRDNYLIPTDADIRKETDVEYESIDFKRILGQMKDAGNRLNIVIIDTCPLNSFLWIKDLASTNIPSGTLVVTSSNNVAADCLGNDRNGNFTKYLLRYITVPALEIREVMMSVRKDLWEDINSQQIPWEHSSLVEKFYFVPPDIRAVRSVK
jgi:hypothetical protein